MKKMMMICAMALMVTSAQAVTVDLNQWSAESYPPVAGFPGGVWSSTSSYAYEHYNGQPTLFYSDSSALHTALEVWVDPIGSDDDYVGFAVGFQPGDTSSASADYLLVDWKRGNQYYNFGAPSDTPGSTAFAGLAVSRVFGEPTADEFWGHLNFDHASSDLSNGLAELDRATSLGGTGWWYDPWIHFRLEYTPTRLKVYVDSSLEIDISGTFGDGRWAFYDFSQAGVYFRDASLETLLIPVDIDIKPGSYPNSINKNGKGVIPVAILGSADFDVTQIDLSTLAFEGAEVRVKGNGAPQCSIEDVSGDFATPEGAPDGYPDLVCQFTDDTSDWDLGAGTATLTGNLKAEFGGTPIEGTDTINVVQ